MNFRDELTEGKKLSQVIDKFRVRFAELASDPSAKALRPVLGDIIERLDDNDIIGAYNVANKAYDRANSRDKIKIELFIEYMDIFLG